jgi:hypothetical protein
VIFICLRMEKVLQNVSDMGVVIPLSRNLYGAIDYGSFRTRLVREYLGLRGGSNGILRKLFIEESCSRFYQILYLIN